MGFQEPEVCIYYPHRSAPFSCLLPTRRFFLARKEPLCASGALSLPEITNGEEIGAAADNLAGGGSGVLLRGRENQWEVIALSLDIGTVRSIEMLGEETFIATSEAIYRLGAELETVDMPKEAGTFGVLRAANGVLWSLGQRDIFFYDGTKWTELIYEG